MGGKFSGILGLVALLSLAACEVAGPVVPSPAPPARPDNLAPAQPAPPSSVSTDRSEASRALSVHFQRLQNDLLARGLLRTDGGGPDTTFTDTLRRWEQPVRFTVEYGATMPADQRVEDSQNVRNFVSRLSRVSGHPMSMSDTNPNFHVLILNEDDRMEYDDRLRALVPGIDDTSVRAFMDVPRDTLCLVLAFSVDGSPQYSQAVALIRGEHPDLMRLACIHEELAQGLGLANDSPRARPSIFNDDEEFGLLTTHDELLLKMLYDDRLETGMEAAEAAPIARVIARELMNSGPS